MSDMDSSPVDVKEESSNSFAESEDKSIKSPPIKSENSDSEVERSENEEEAEENDAEENGVNENDDNEIDDNKSESNEPLQMSAAVEEENSIDSNDVEANENDDEDDQLSAKDDDQSSNKDDQLSTKEEPLDSDNVSESDEEGEQKQEPEEEAKSDQEEEAKSDQEEVDSDDEMSEKQMVKDRREANEIFGNSDSENEDEDEIEPARAAGKRKLESSNEDSDDEFFSPKKKKPARVIKDSDEEQASGSDEEGGEPKKRKLSDAESDDELENELKELDNQDEKAEQAEKQDDANQEDQEELDNKKVLPDISSSSEDELEDDRQNRSDLVYDFDIMMAKRKEQNARNRKRRNTDLINDSDDFIAHLLSQMKQAAEEDFELNKQSKAATRKMKLLPSVQAYLRKIDLRESFLDSGVLGIIADWLTRLPDGSLPNLQVRETMLKILLEMNIMDVDRLKSSGIGKAVMYLFKHPKETKDNKRKASQLIMNWSRPIFNCETDYQSISKEDREQRDYDLMQKVQRKRSDEAASSQAANSANETQAVLRPGDKGWVPRARVPAPSTKDYVVRPKSTVDIEIGRSSKRQATRFDKHLRSFQEKKRSSKMQRAVKISIEGRKL